MGNPAGTIPRPALATGPRWLAAIDAVCIVVLNLAVGLEVAIVFLNTVLRVFHTTLMPGMDETARLLLICLAFLGGAVAYGRGQFMAITYVVGPHAGPAAAAASRRTVDWLVILIAAVIGGASIPLQILNAGETTTMLGIGYVWMTAPMTAGLRAVHPARRGARCARGRSRAVLGSLLLVAAVVAAIVLGRERRLGGHAGALRRARRRLRPADPHRRARRLRAGLGRQRSTST